MVEATTRKQREDTQSYGCLSEGGPSLGIGGKPKGRLKKKIANQITLGEAEWKKMRKGPKWL